MSQMVKPIVGLGVLVAMAVLIAGLAGDYPEPASTDSLRLVFGVVGAAWLIALASWGANSSTGGGE